jgi:hypothetical protein
MFEAGAAGKETTCLTPRTKRGHQSASDTDDAASAAWLNARPRQNVRARGFAMLAADTEAAACKSWIITSSVLRAQRS